MIFWSGHEKIPHVQGQEWQLRFAGVAVRRCHMSKVRSYSCAWLERLWGDTSCPRAKEKPQQEGKRGQIHTENQTPSLPETLRGLKQTLCSSGPRDPTETETELFEHLLWRYGSAVACHRGRGSGCSRPGCGISPLGGGHH